MSTIDKTAVGRAGQPWSALGLISLGLGLLLNQMQGHFPGSLASVGHFAAGGFLGLAIPLLLVSLVKQKRARDAKRRLA